MDHQNPSTSRYLLGNLKLCQNEQFGKIGRIPKDKHEDKNSNNSYKDVIKTSLIEMELDDFHRPCNCMKSYCLKLYCECFARDKLCVNCNCTNCMNNQSHENTRSSALIRALDKNPLAFTPKIDSGYGRKLHRKGCNCKRSECLKNYCECREAKIECSSLCRCHGCKNHSFKDSRSNNANISQNKSIEQSQPKLISKIPNDSQKYYDYPPPVPIRNESKNAVLHQLNPTLFNQPMNYATLNESHKVMSNHPSIYDNNSFNFSKKNQRKFSKSDIEDYIKVKNTYKKISEEITNEYENLKELELRTAKKHKLETTLSSSFDIINEECDQFMDHKFNDNRDIWSPSVSNVNYKPEIPSSSIIFHSLTKDFNYQPNICIMHNNNVCSLNSTRKISSHAPNHNKDIKLQRFNSNTNNNEDNKNITVLSVQSSTTSNENNAEVTSTIDIEHPTTMNMDLTTEHQVHSSMGSYIPNYQMSPNYNYTQLPIKKLPYNHQNYVNEILPAHQTYNYTQFTNNNTTDNFEVQENNKPPDTSEGIFKSWNENINTCIKPVNVERKLENPNFLYKSQHPISSKTIPMYRPPYTPQNFCNSQNSVPAHSTISFMCGLFPNFPASTNNTCYGNPSISTNNNLQMDYMFNCKNARDNNNYVDFLN